MANALRILAIDAVEQAKSGHPGMPMGMADIATVLWHQHLCHHPGKPTWMNRDRFILSNGHGSMLLYALLHLSGYPIDLDDIKNFRTLGSKTAGHPEYEPDLGIETTTGPLGQGLANAVGMAIAEKHLSAQFNRPNHHIIDHHTYCFVGDGCLMEGISHEASSLAGTLNLGKLIVFWDNNRISLDGELSGWCKENTLERYKSYGFDVIEIDGHDPQAIHQAILDAKKSPKPSLISCKTIIGFGAPNQSNTASVHGAPLGQEEIRLTREKLGWETHTPFAIPDEIYALWHHHKEGEKHHQDWFKGYQAYQKAYPELAKALERRMQGKLPSSFETWQKDLVDTWQKEARTEASRKSSGLYLRAVTQVLPELFGGSADVSDSTQTLIKDTPAFHQDASGRFLHYGVREFAMFAISNGLSLHGGLIPYAGTFFTFVDYGRNALRLAAMMKLRMISVLTHDSIGLGEDGPTHQPVEHLSILRATPGIETWRPASPVETAIAWSQAIQRQGPSALVLSRQSLPAIHHRKTDDIQRGLYPLIDTAEPELVILATGSEVSLALAAIEARPARKIKLISCPCLCRLHQWTQAEREALMPENTPRLIIEAGSAQSWGEIKRSQDVIVSIDTYGVSAPGKEALSHFGFDQENICSIIDTLCPTS